MPSEAEQNSPVAASPVAASPVAASPVAASPVAASPVAASATAASATAADETPETPAVTSSVAEAQPVADVALASQSAQLSAPRVRYGAGSIIAEGGVVYVSGENTIHAQRVEINTVSGDIVAMGEVLVERATQVKQSEIAPKGLPKRSRLETVIETLRGENLIYNARTQRGTVDKAELQLANFSVSTSKLTINGQRYEAQNVVLRPALTAAEEKIYGRPPFSIRARLLTAQRLRADSAEDARVSTTGLPGSAASSGNQQTYSRGGTRIAAKGAGLYYKNTRILPIPSYALRQVTTGAGDRSDRPYQITPRLSFNSTDKILLTTNLRFPLGKNPLGPSLAADLGLSQRVGVRGGATLQYPTRIGDFLLRGRKNDIVTTQLTNRIVLDRTPEVVYSLPTIKLLRLPGGRSARLGLDVSTGRYAERTVGGGGGSVEANRSTLDIVATTRSESHDGPYLELFALASRYSNFTPRYRTNGFEVGYYGNISSRVRGLFSYRAADVKGTTPFRFDRVEIAHELRSTFDISLSPRYIIPIDLRYDLDLGKLRDKRFGLLRNYKTFAYGVTYQTARKELKLEVRQGF